MTDEELNDKPRNGPAVTTQHIRLGTFNYKRGGWSDSRRHHDFTPLLRTLSQAPPPHVLSLPEASMYHEFHEQPLWELVGRLNELWAGTDVYYPFLSQRAGSRNHPLLLVAARRVRPICWESPGRNTRRVRENFLLAGIGSRQVYLHAIHWDGGSGPAEMNAQAIRTAQHAAYPTILLGDFNATSSTDGETLYQDWHERMAPTPWKHAQKATLGPDSRWHIDPHPIDYLLNSGFTDAGQQAGDFTVTVNPSAENSSGLRIDRIMWSPGLEAELVPDSYRVFIPETDQMTVSDHRYVVATLAITT